MPKKQYIPVPLYLTDDKVAEIKAELAELENVVMPAIRTRLATAYEDGDMPENNPWLTAAEELNNAMGRRNQLLDLLARRKKLSKKTPAQKITLGSTVTIKIYNKLATYLLVSSEEADSLDNKLSIDSPIGLALLGKKSGDKVVAKTPGGELEILIL